MACVGMVFGSRLIPGTPLGSPILGALAALWLAAWLESKDQSATEESLAAMPDVLDRMAVCALSGRSVEQSLRIVARRAPGPAGSSLRAAAGILDAGGSRSEALAHLIKGDSGGAWTEPVAAMERAERLGVPISDVLVGQAREQRAQLRAVLEARARAAPVKIVFPLVFCFLPAFLVLAVGPVALSAMRTLTSL